MKIDITQNPTYSSPKQLWDETQSYLKQVGVLYVERYFPFILSSIGSHIANLRNKKYKGKGNLFYGVAGGTPDLRLHLITIAPPGFSKSFNQNLLFNTYNGVATTYPNTEVGMITEAGLVGSFDGEGKKILGLAEEYDNAIIWSEEFAAQTQTMKQEHSANLDVAFLKLLDDGKVEKRLKNGKIEFQSYMTMHAGTQNERLDLASGMARRLFVIDATPDERDVQAYVEAYRKSRGVFPDFNKISSLRDQFGYLYDNFNVPGQLIFDSSYDNLAYSLRMTHTEIILFEKLAIGYNVMTNYKYDDTDLIIKADKQLKEMFEYGWTWRNIMMGESMNVQILKLIRERDWPLSELKRRLQSLGITFAQSSERINSLIARQVLRKHHKEQTNPGRPVTWITKGSEWFDIWKYMKEDSDNKLEDKKDNNNMSKT